MITSITMTMKINTFYSIPPSVLDSFFRMHDFYVGPSSLGIQRDFKRRWEWEKLPLSTIDQCNDWHGSHFGINSFYHWNASSSEIQRMMAHEMFLSNGFTSWKQKTPYFSQFSPIATQNWFLILTQSIASIFKTMI